MQHLKSVLWAGVMAVLVLVVVCAFTTESVPLVAAIEALDIRSAEMKDAVSMEAIRARLLIRGTCDSFVALRSASAAAHVCCKRKQLSIPFGLIGVSMVETKFSALVSTSGACRTKHKISKDEKRAYHQALNIEDTCQYFIVF